MARHNYVNTIAFVLKPPHVKDDLGDKTSMVALCTIMSPREAIRSTTGYQCHSVHFLLKSRETAMAEVITKLKVNDIVEVTGFLATKEKDRSVDIKICPHCGAENVRGETCISNGKIRAGGNSVFVYPISVRVLQQCETEQEAFTFLHAYREDVNRVFMLGNVTSPPYTDKLNGGHKTYTRYQLAVNRKYRAQSGAEIYDRTDYPWIYAYDTKAEEDFENLEKGALVFVDGALQARKYKEQYICSNCGKEFSVRGRTLEILSYDTEYLRLPNYNEEDADAIEDAEMEFKKKVKSKVKVIVKGGDDLSEKYDDDFEDKLEFEDVIIGGGSDESGEGSDGESGNESDGESDGEDLKDIKI